MKTILLVSDTHCERKILQTILKKNPNCDVYIHCGDSQLSSSDEAIQPFVVVAGNTDSDRTFLTDEVLEFSPYTLFITHGHHYQVNWQLSELTRAAKSYGAQIACFGHTHIPYCGIYDGILCLNPGSAISPRGNWQFGTYAIVTFDETSSETQITIRFYMSQTHELVDEQIVHMS
ncbi:MAG: metallophosphoesterase family protein [Culicoidibacterales bacterium]